MNTYRDLRNSFNTNITLDLNWRKTQLRQLLRFIDENEKHIFRALHTDLRKSPEETFLTEIAFLKTELNIFIKNLNSWAKPEKHPTPWMLFPAKSYTLAQPLGAVLIISPWNYPLLLTLSPAAAAIAAGNTFALKPSEFAPETANLLAERLHDYIAPETSKICTGGPEVAENLTKQPFDSIFFTGSQSVAKKVALAAAQNLTPLNLELGGKSPVIVQDSKNIPLAAKRIIWGKILAAGQTCVAPDYILVQKKLQNPLTRELQKQITAQLGTEPIQNPAYPRIVNRKHFERLTRLLQNTKIISGGAIDAENLLIEPAIIENPDPDSPLMTDEIFGPLLPVIPFEKTSEAIDFINRKPDPLALYIFTDSKKNLNTYLEKTRSGGVCINDTVIHIANPNLPFGGTGASGYGKTHAKHAFMHFSNQKAVMKQSRFIDIPLKYQPFRSNLIKILKKIISIPG